MAGFLDSITLGIYGYFAVIILTACLHLLGGILTMGLKVVCGRYLFHLSWCLMSLLMTIGFLLVSILWPVAGIFFEVCEVVEKVLTNE